MAGVAKDDVLAVAAHLVSEHEAVVMEAEVLFRGDSLFSKAPTLGELEETFSKLMGTDKNGWGVVLTSVQYVEAEGGPGVQVSMVKLGLRLVGRR